MGYQHLMNWVAIKLVQGLSTQIAMLMGPTWDPSGSCRPQMGPMLAPWTLLSGYVMFRLTHQCSFLYREPQHQGATMLSPHTSFHQHSEAVTRWLTFDRRQFEMQFIEKKMFIWWFQSQWMLFLGVILTIQEIVFVKAWCRTGDKPLPEPVKAHLTSGV